MSVAAFKYFTIQLGGTPQPLIGSYLTVAVTQAQANAANNLNAQQSYPLVLTVADSSMFVGFNWIDVTDPVTYATERVMITGVLDATHVQVQGIKNAHPGGAYGTGAWVALGALAQDVFVQGLDGSTAALYIGVTPKMVKATGVGVIFKLFNTAGGTNPFYFSTSRQGLANTECASQYWIDGTTGDTYLPSIGQV
jgi:hypothetical protein